MRVSIFPFCNRFHWSRSSHFFQTERLPRNQEGITHGSSRCAKAWKCLIRAISHTSPFPPCFVATPASRADPRPALSLATRPAPSAVRLRYAATVPVGSRASRRRFATSGATTRARQQGRLPPRALGTRSFTAFPLARVAPTPRRTWGGSLFSSTRRRRRQRGDDVLAQPRQGNVAGMRVGLLLHSTTRALDVSP